MSILIEPEDVKEWPEGKQVTASFNFSGNRYWYIREEQLAESLHILKHFAYWN